jgi:hypothetical protein
MMVHGHASPGDFCSSRQPATILEDVGSTDLPQKGNSDTPISRTAVLCLDRMPKIGTPAESIWTASESHSQRICPYVIGHLPLLLLQNMRFATIKSPSRGKICAGEESSYFVAGPISIMPTDSFQSCNGDANKHDESFATASQATSVGGKESTSLTSLQVSGRKRCRPDDQDENGPFPKARSLSPAKPTSRRTSGRIPVALVPQVAVEFVGDSPSAGSPTGNEQTKIVGDRANALADRASGVQSSGQFLTVPAANRDDLTQGNKKES